MQGSVRKEVRGAYILGSLFSALVMPVQILLYCFSTSFPHTTRQKLGIYPIVGRHFLFPTDSSPYPMLPAIVLQLSLSRDHL
jgi:hypothetical protein